MKEKILLSWSGGKDSAYSLYELKRAAEFEVAALITTITDGYDRISMHGARCVLLEQQAASLGIPVDKVVITPAATNPEYEARMQAVLERYLHQGISKVAFGDIFLEDLRAYREKNLARIGMTAVFPIWKRETPELARAVVASGFRAVLTCVDSKTLDGNFVGREFDERLLADLPPSVDPCGENGEFHSFVYDGPNFQKSISWSKGEIAFRDERFYFCDLIPKENN